MSAQEVVHFTADDIDALRDFMFNARSARLMIDDGGIKVSCDRSVWSFPPFGQVGYPEVGE